MQQQAAVAAAGRLRRARAGALVAFVVTGLVSASWFGRIPAVQGRLDLSAGELAVAVLGVEGGAVLGLSLGGALATRWGSRRAAQAGFVVYAPGVLVAALAPDLLLLTCGLAVWAAANSVLDVALNVQGVDLERRAGRPLLSGLQAAQGLGLLAGAAGATAAAAADVPLTAHLAAVAAAGLVAGLAGTAPMLPAAAPPPRGRSRFRPSGQLLLVGAIAFCAFLVDGAATNWVAVSLEADHGAAPGAAAGGFLAFTATLVLGRAVTDRVLLRWSRVRLVRGCGAVVVLGTVLVVLAPTGAVALAGWVVLGLGVAPLAPAVLGAAPDARSRATGRSTPPPAAIATVTTIGYVGSFTGAPAIGALAGLVGLSSALALMALAGIATVLLARYVPSGRPVDGGGASGW
ncbi:hypothetical protein [Geodermatophilus sp. SYSU D00710]